MVKDDQSFVDPLEYMSEEDLELLEDLAEDSVEEIRKEESIDFKIDKIMEWVIAVGDNDNFVAIMVKMAEMIEDISYNNHQKVSKLVDDCYWEANYNYYGAYEDTALGKLFNERKTDYTRVHTPTTPTKTVVTKTVVKPDFIELKPEAYTLKLKYSLSALATAKLFTMMKYYQNVEWGAYMKLDKALPKLEDLYTQGEWEIEVLDIILIPQIRSTAHVEYLENELPEFMEEWKEAKINKFYVNSGRIHSHHTMGSWHSATDTGEFKEAFGNQDRMLSIVTAFSDKKNKIDQSKDLNDWDYYFKALEFDCVLFIPLVGDQKTHIDCDYGYQVRNSIFLTPYGIDEINEAIEWRQKFEEMDIFVNQKYPVIQKLLRLQEIKKISDIDFYHIRSQLFTNENMFNFVQDLIILLSETKNELNNQSLYKSRIAEIKKITERP